MNCKNIIEHVEKLCPKGLAMEWDNVGLLIGNPNQAVKKVLIALDAVDQVIEEAIHNKADMIITHHPLFNPKYSEPITNITTETPLGRFIYKLIQNNISLYSAHTNLDITKGGVNDTLAELLELNDISVLEVTESNVHPLENKNQQVGLGRIGYLHNEISLFDFAKIVKNKLHIDTLKIIGNTKAIVKKVAICSGSGMSLLDTAVKSKADVYLTGDVKYHDAQNALALGINVIDAGHYQTENIIIPVLKEYIKRLGEVEVLESKVDINPFKTI